MLLLAVKGHVVSLVWVKRQDLPDKQTSVNILQQIQGWFGCFFRHKKPYLGLEPYTVVRAFALHAADRFNP